MTNHQIPSHVWATLTEAEKQETQLFLKSDKQNSSMLFPGVQSSNKGVWYVMISSMLKYEFVIHNPHVTSDDLTTLLEWSRQHVDDFHKIMGHSLVEAEPIQTVNLACAMFQNPTVTEKFASYLVETIIDCLYLQGCTSREEAVNLIGYTIFDKWTPSKYNNNVRKVLIKTFKETDSTYKRRIRLKKE